MIDRLRVLTLSLLLTVKVYLGTIRKYGFLRYILLCVHDRRICIECEGTGIKIKRGID